MFNYQLRKKINKILKLFEFFHNLGALSSGKGAFTETFQTKYYVVICYM